MRGAIVCILLIVSYCNPETSSLTDDIEPASNDSTTVYIPNDFVKVYETSFENVTGLNKNNLSWDFPHWFEYAAMHIEDGGYGRGNGGGRKWVERNIVRTGKKSIGMELYDIARSRRAELVIFPGEILNNEYYLSYWIFLPIDWGLFDPNIEWDWFEIGNPFNSNGLPYAAIYISEPDLDQNNFKVSVGGRDTQGTLYEIGSKRIDLPKSRWFNITYYVKRDDTDGAIKLWFDDHLIGEMTGFSTKNPDSDAYNISIAKIYHERGDTTTHRMWIDDLSIYTKPEN